MKRFLLVVPAAAIGAAAGNFIGKTVAVGAFTLPPNWAALTAGIVTAIVATFAVHFTSTFAGPAGLGTRAAYAAMATVIPAFGLTASRSTNIFVRLAGQGGELVWPAVTAELASNLSEGLRTSCRSAVDRLREDPLGGLRAVLITRIGLAIAGVAGLSAILLDGRATQVMPAMGAISGGILAALPILRLRAHHNPDAATEESATEPLTVAVVGIIQDDDALTQ